MSMDKILEQKNEELADLQEQWEELKDDMASPKAFKDLKDLIETTKEELETLENIHDCAKDEGTYDKGFEWNLEDYINKEKEASFPSPELDILFRIQRAFGIKESSSQESYDDSTNTDGKQQDTDSKQQNTDSKQHNNSNIDTDMEIPGSFLDDID